LEACEKSGSGLGRIFCAHNETEMRVLRPATFVVASLLCCAAAALAPLPGGRLPPPYAPRSVLTARPPDARVLDAADFGAVGDGVADDTAALQRAINATYAAPAGDCTTSGAHVVALRGDGRAYRLTAPLRLWIWVRLVGYGETARPVLLLAENTPGYGNAAAPLPLVVVVNFAPVATGQCAANASDGGNTAFGVGVLNVDVEVLAGNAGAVGVRNRAAQGGVLRAMRFTLASDALAGVMAPGWAHQELVFVGGQHGVIVEKTGAWPSVFRDCAFSGQTVAGVSWSAAMQNDWTGASFVRCLFADAAVAVDLSKSNDAARCSLLDCVFANITRALIAPPPLKSGNSSLLVRGCVAAAAPGLVIMAPSDAGPAVPAPTAPNGEPSFFVRELIAGRASRNVTVGAGGADLRLAAGDCDAVADARAPPAMPPPPDTPPFAPVEQWVSVRDHGVVGDGVTDDAPALNALLAAAAAGGSPAPIFFPLGRYKLGSTLVVPASSAGARLHLFGLHCWDVALTLADSLPAFQDPADPRPIVDVRPGSEAAGGAAPWISGMSVRSGFTWASRGPNSNSNPGALAVLWRSDSEDDGGLQDVFLKPETWPDNTRDPSVANTELSLVVRDGGGGVFADIWTANAFSQGGVRVVDTARRALFYQLSSEHHAGHELWVSNATRVEVHVMQTEDRSPDAAPTSSVRAELSSRVLVTGLFSYYAAAVPSPGAVVADASSSLDVAVHRQYHSYHPMYYNCSMLLETGAGDGGAACVLPADYALAQARARSGELGHAATITGAPPSPSCALNGLPCPPPRWAPTWNLTQSTVIQTGHTSGFFMPEHTWGLVSLDWSVARETWFTGNATNSTCEATLRANCGLLKAAGKATRCFGYHNSELALEWLESNRALMRDPANANLFLQYLPGNPSGAPAGTVYHVPNPYGDQVFFNHSNIATQLAVIESLVAVVTAGPELDGAFTDDVDGLPAEHPDVPAALGMSADAVATLRYATQSMGAALIAALTLAGRYTWQAFGSRDTSAPGPHPHAVARGFVGVTPASCAAFMRTYCAVEYQARPMLMHMDVAGVATANATVAAFLITRPPYAYLGYAWESNDANFSSLFYLAVGEPTAFCAEGPDGVFARPYSLGTPRLDCNSFEAELPFGFL
jgi:hypothetical protein